MLAYEMKGSSVEVLADIPKHWGIGKVKNGFYLKPSNVDKKSHDDEIVVELCNYVDVYYNDFIVNELPFMEATAKQTEIDKFSLQIDDVIITKDSEDPMDIGVPALVKENKPSLVCGYHLTMLKKRLNNVSGAFLFWALKDSAIASQLYREATGVTRWAISSRNIKNVSIPYPPFDEQKSIADYLDKACEKIDKTLSIKQQQLDKLEAYRKSIIHEAVTKGLDKNVPMTDSGVEWLGKVNASWKVVKLKRVLAEKLKYGANESAELDDTSLPRYIRITDFGNDGKLKANTFKSLKEETAKPYMLKQGDVLFARSGATVGKTFQFKNYNGKACFAGYLIKATVSSAKMTSDFLYYYTKSTAYSNWKDIIFTQATIQNIGADKYQYLDITQPPIEDQEAIADYLDKACEKIDKTKAVIELQITKLTQYRQSLIHECVTGKKRVYQGDIY